MKEDKNIKEYISGRLYQMMGQCSIISHLKTQRYLNLGELRFGWLAKLILNARMDGCNWVWNTSEIEYDDEIEDYILPTVDLNGFLDLESNNDIKKLFKKNKCDTKNIEWDTENGGWYPKFKTRHAAVKCIQDIDRLFDERYQKQLEGVEDWE